MRRKVILFLLVLTPFTLLKGQNDCKVMVPALQGVYQGGCKKGLAHGKGFAKGKDQYTGDFKKGFPDGSGTYVWSNGSVYVGEWRKGKRNGKGSYTYRVDGHDTLIRGVWKNDRYLGVEKQKPRVLSNKFVDSYEFLNMGGAQNQVLIQFMQNGSPNRSVSNVMISSGSGTLVKRGQLIGFENVTFPVTISVRYNTLNKMGTWTVNCFIEFEIFEAGDWLVRLKN